MPLRDLESSLMDHDLVVLRVIGEWWGLDLTGSQKLDCARILAETLGQVNMMQELAYLDPDEAQALQELVEVGGRMAVAPFERRHGPVRQMGPGRLEREEPWLDPAGPAEALWYHGLLYRSFDEIEGDVIESYFVPEELYARFPQTDFRDSSSESNELPPIEPVAAPDAFVSGTPNAVHDLTALLAAAQLGPIREGEAGRLMPLLLVPHPDRLSLLLTLAEELELLRGSAEGSRPTRLVVDWLNQSLEAQSHSLVDAWSRSAWNDLCHTPGLVCEGSAWHNEPILARAALLDVLVRSTDWFETSAVVELIKTTDPDFQRPDGDYDTWYIRDATSMAYITGFENWDNVERRLIHFMLEGPLAWLGMVDIATGHDGPETLFRLSEQAVNWLEGRPPNTEEVTAPIVVQEDATLLVPQNANRYHRFQIARIAEPRSPELGKPQRYVLTPRSLTLAREQGVRPDRLLSFLADASGRPIPSSFRRAVERWAKNGTEARLQRSVILQVKEAEILEKLRANARTRPYLAESLGELAVKVREDDWPVLRSAAAQLGLLLDTGALFE
jgi:hypothetical protein